jgi:hypothetical protein
MDMPREPELSLIFTRLAEQSKKVEDAFADLATVTDTKAAERRDQAQAAANEAVKQLDAATNQMNQDVAATQAAMAADWRAMQAGIDQEIRAMQADISARKHERDVKQAEQHAEAAKARASWAASYVVAASEMARMAALDAEVARREADSFKRK